MKRLLSLLMIFCCIVMINAQTLSLEECQKLAQENYPLIVQKDLIEKSGEFTVSNAKHNWLPKISLTAQATYQSDVVALPDDLENILKILRIPYDGLHKDQYKAVVQIEQIIYAGGAVKSQIEIAKAESEASRQNWEIEMYNLRERVNQLYFGTLLLQEKTKEIDIMIDELRRNRNLIEIYIKNGIALQSDLDKIAVEQLSANQQKSELIASQKAYRTMLGIMINAEIADELELLKPEIPVVSSENSINRPELNYFEAQEKRLDAQIKALNSIVKPQIGAFFQGAYANPGINMFEDMKKNQWSPYFITGIKFQWNISGWYNRKNDLSRINLDRSRISSQRENFLYNIELKSTQENIAIEHMREVMKDDDEIIELRSSIRKRTESQLTNGVSTVSDLTRDLHAENLARQNKITHEIELLKNLYDLKFTRNK